MASREEVIFAYRYLLGREAESEAIVLEYGDSVDDWRSLRRLFLESEEYRSIPESMPSPASAEAAMCAPAMSVETEASPGKLEELFAVIAAQWNFLGEQEPHWSVLTEDKYLKQQFGKSRDEFYASGALEIRMLDAALARAGIDPRALRSCLEFGCGVGRVTAHLAGRFDHVTGVDVSSGHLRSARDFLASRGISNIDLRKLHSVQDVTALGHFDFVFSRMVFQHNPPPVTARLLRDLLSLLNPAGIALVQIPTYCPGYRFRIDDYLASPDCEKMETHFFPQTALLRLISECHCELLEVKEDPSLGQRKESISNSLLIRKLGPEETP